MLHKSPSFMRLKKRFIILIFILLTGIYCIPILQNLNSAYRGDFDQMLFYDEVPQASVLAYHQIPLWNPYYCGGTSLIGNPQIRFLSPFMIINLITGVFIAIKIKIIIYIFYGMLSMYMLCRFLKISDPPSILAAIIFMLNGSIVLHITAGHLWILPIAHLPLVLLFYLKGLNQIKYLFLSAFFLTLILFDGGIYVLPFSCILLLTLSILLSIQKRDLRFIYSAGILFLIFVLFSGPKLFPTLEWLHQFPRFTDLDNAIPLKYLFNIFISPDQGMISSIYRQDWWEVGVYVGIIPISIFLMSFGLFKKYWPWYVAGIIFLLIGIGNFSIMAPWTLLHKLPIFDKMWVPSRAFVMFIFVFSILLAKYLDQSNTLRNFRFKIIFLCLLCSFVYVDFARVNSLIFYEAFSSLKLRNELITKIGSVYKGYKNNFYQINMSKHDQFKYGSWSAMYPTILDNIGIINGYESVPVLRKAAAVGEKNYKGEYYLSENNGKVDLLFWSPNKMVFDVSLNKADVLLINQNFDKNWKTNVLHKAESHEGLLSIRLNPLDSKVTLYYLPNSFLLGLAASMLGIFTFIFHKRIFFFRKKQNTLFGFDA